MVILRVILILLLLATPSLAGTVTGRVEVIGKYGIKPGKERNEMIKAEGSLVVSVDRGLKNAVVSIEGAKGFFYPPKEQPLINQWQKTYIPHVLPVLAGTTVRFESLDPFVHRVISNSEAKYIRQELSYKGASFEITFDRLGVVRLRSGMRYLEHREKRLK